MKSTPHSLAVTLALLGGAITFAPDEAQAADWIIENDSSESRPWELGILVGVPYCCGVLSENSILAN